MKLFTETPLIRFSINGSGYGFLGFIPLPGLYRSLQGGNSHIQDLSRRELELMLSGSGMKKATANYEATDYLPNILSSWIRRLSGVSSPYQQIPARTSANPAVQACSFPGFA